MAGAKQVLQTTGPVHIIGAGLLGASIGLALRAAGVNVTLADASPVALGLARDLGAGELATGCGPSPQLVVVATPPDVTASVVKTALRDHPGAWVTDVASVKSRIAHQLEGIDTSRYVGSHPMAGREKTGAAAARADLFSGRPWVIVEEPDTNPEAIKCVRALAVDLGSVPISLDAEEHDCAVALVSHVPQIVSTLLASRLREASAQALSLSGQGLRDVTRIAASDPVLWTAILTGNAQPVARELRALRGELDAVIAGLEAGAEGGGLAPGAVGPIATALEAGREGVEKIPGKHGGVRRLWSEITVVIPDEPGKLARMLTEVGAAGINVEDLKLEHSARQKVGLAILSVDPAQANQCVKELSKRGWKTLD